MSENLSLGGLTGESAADHPELLAPTTRAAIAETGPSVFVTPIDPAVSDTAAFCATYDIPLEASANCVVLCGKRGGEQKWAAAVVLATTRADVNGVARRLMDVRKVSFAAQAEAVEQTGMEYGGITPIGLPPEWPIYVDEAVTTAGTVIVGSGIRGSKILVDGADLGRWPGVIVVSGLAAPRADS